MSAAVLATAGFGLNSCDIDMLPLNEVVLENFWTNKDDVESVVNACYAAVQADDYVERLIVWGEDRSDNVTEGNSLSEDLKYLLKGSIKTTNQYCSWADFYVAINRCNTVLEYAPVVAQKDPNYTESDLRINIAECKFLRAYSYFTLVKSFKNVPFTMVASIDDTQEYRLPQTAGEQILDSLIEDLEGCKDFAPRKYPENEKLKNSGRVTRAAMYALLADIYLWRASDVNLSVDKQNELYKKSIECCDYVLAYKLQQYKDNSFVFMDDVKEKDIRQHIDKEVYNEYGYPLLAEETTVGQNEGGPKGYNMIFGSGGSFETIFEIRFKAGSSTTTNSALMDMYGSSSTNKVVANEKMITTKPENSNSYTDQKLFSVPSDYRSMAPFYYKADATDWTIYKYVVENNKAGDSREKFGSVGTAFTPGTAAQSTRSDNAPNWILYRLTEVMLMRAEAEIELANNMPAPVTEETTTEAKKNQHRSSTYVDGASLSTADDLCTDAFNLISAVYRRSNPVVKNQAKYAPTKPTTIDGFRKLLMNERRREFLFEGKRYFDLVRLSRREGNTRQFRDALSQKYGDAGAAVAMKMVQMDFMYLPVARSEMKVNPNLVQNQCYLDEEENIKN